MASHLKVVNMLALFFVSSVWKVKTMMFPILLYFRIVEQEAAINLLSIKVIVGLLDMIVPGNEAWHDGENCLIGW